MPSLISSGVDWHSIPNAVVSEGEAVALLSESPKRPSQVEARLSIDDTTAVVVAQRRYGLSGRRS